MGLTVAFCGLIILTIYRGILGNAGKTFYGRHLDLGYLSKVARTFFEVSAPYIGLMYATGLLAIAAGRILRTDLSSRGPIQRRFFFNAIAGLGALLWIIIFYAGDWPTFAANYDFPGLLLAPACIGLCLFLLEGTLKNGSWSTITRPLLFCFVGVALSVYLGQNGFPARQRMIDSASRSNRYQGDLAGIAESAAIRPNYPIVFSVAHPLDVETVFSSHVFLRSKGVNNRFYIVGPDLIQAAGTNPHWLGAARELMSMMDGTRGFQDYRSLPREVANAGGAYILRLSTEASQLNFGTELPFRWH